MLRENPHPKAALSGLCLGMALLYMNTTMVTQSLPVLAADLLADSSQLEWIISAYNLAFLAVLLPGGALGDRWEHRRLLLGGVFLFGAGAAVATTATHPIHLTIARIIMGIGASAFTPMSLALLPHLFNGRKKQVATSIWTISGALGAPLGPPIGGALIDLIGWRGIFGFDAIVSIIVGLICLAFIPAFYEPGREIKIPVTQTIISASGFGLITWGLINASDSWKQTTTWIPLFGGIILCTVFVWKEKHRSPALTDLSLLTQHHYGRAALSLAIMNFVLFGLLYATPAYFQTVLGYNATIGGLLLMPIVISAIPGSAITGLISNHIYARRWLLPATLTVLSLGCNVAAFSSPDSPIMTVIGLLIIGFAMGIGQSAAFGYAMDKVSAKKRASGAALLNTIRQFGALIGTALIGSTISTLYQYYASQNLASSLPADYDTAPLFDSLHTAHQAAVTNLPPQKAHTLLVAANLAYTHALNWVLAGCAAVSLGVAVIFFTHQRKIL